MTLLLNERQKTAERLTRELSQLGATVTSNLPLGEDQNLRFWCSDYTKREVLQALADAGYEPIFTGMSQQADVKSYSMGLVNNFEISIPRERQSVAADNTIYGERSTGKKEVDVEMEGFRKYFGWDKVRK